MINRLLERPSGYGVSGNEIGNLAQDVSLLWRQLPVPVIAVLHGMCFGAGLQIALGADMRYSTPDCNLSSKCWTKHTHTHTLIRTNTKH
jgi:enoyl-CoA hydratase/carnithine racemase